jgi:hypothetical protein
MGPEASGRDVRQGLARHVVSHLTMKKIKSDA